MVEIYADNWMMAMGLVGLCRLFKEEIILTKFGISFDLKILESLPEKYYEYMINEFNIAERDKKRMEDRIKYAQNKEYFKRNYQSIKNNMAEQLKKINRYFKNDPDTEKLKEILVKVKKIKSVEEIEVLRQCVDSYCKIMSKKEFNEKLTINFFKASIMTDFYGQVSFLNVSKNKLTKKEQIELFYKDYIKPVFWEEGLQELIEKEEDFDKAINYLEDNKEYKPLNTLFNSLKKKKSLKEIKDYIEEKHNKCSIIEDRFAYCNYEEMIFSPLGVSLSKSLNFSWNLNKKEAVPISSLAKLVLFLAPIGVAFYNRKEGYGKQGVYRSYAGFVQSDASFPEILRMNNAFRRFKKDDNPFNEVVHDLLQDSLTRADKITKQLFFLEMYSEYQGKKTLLDYYHMPPYIAKYFKQYGDKLKAVHIKEFREEFTRTALKGIEPINVVFNYLRYLIANNNSGFGAYIAVRELNRIHALKKGVNNVSNEDKKVYVVFKQGQEIRNLLLQRTESRKESSDSYIASGSKKINSLAYRLLNASKAGDKANFMDTLFRIHVSADKEVSSIFLNSIHEKDLKFETVASAFIAGLLSDSFKKDKEESA